jgi:hypothetical protein
MQADSAESRTIIRAYAATTEPERESQPERLVHVDCYILAVTDRHQRDDARCDWRAVSAAVGQRANLCAGHNASACKAGLLRHRARATTPFGILRSGFG